MTDRFKTVIGLMSGTSLDGIDAALIETDGETVRNFGKALTLPFEDNLKKRLLFSINAGEVIDSQLECDLTNFHAKAVKELLEIENKTSEDIDLIGFHGQTIFHDPENGVTNQIGDGNLLASLTSIDVVNDFRTNDVKNGGQGAPLIPLFHQALFTDHKEPIAVVNIGGVSNITYIDNTELIAFDTGPGNAIIDDLIRKHSKGSYDKDGAFASKGNINEEILADLIENPFFDIKPPKSLDRNNFKDVLKNVDNLSLEDASATLTAFVASTIIMADKHLSNKPIMTYITGGGSKNKFLMQCLSTMLDGKVKPIEDAGFNSEFIEAQGFAFLAVRSLYNMPLSLPSTTGVKKPITGGEFNLSKPKKS